MPPVSAQQGAPSSPVSHPAHRVHNEPFSHIHVNIIGPLPASHGYTHLMCIDCTTHWPEAIPLSSTMADTCACSLLQEWVSCFRIPCDIMSGREVQFTSSLWITLAGLLSTDLHHTLACHPHSNGLVEGCPALASGDRLGWTDTTG